MANIYQQTPEKREQDRLLEANNEKLILENQNLAQIYSATPTKEGKVA